jgi:hypothetical protein
VGAEDFREALQTTPMITITAPIRITITAVVFILLSGLVSREIAAARG